MKIFNYVSYYLGFILLSLGLISLFFRFNFYFDSNVLFLEWEILSISSSSVIITLLIDWMSLSFIGLVILISSMVLFYRTYYIEGDKFFVRFILLVYLFVLSIIFLIVSPNIIRILLGWDGLGLVSYCLVIYYQNIKSANAGIITILSNRVGDVAILLGIAWILNFGRWNFYYVQFMYTSRDLIILLLLIVLAAITKRAQMPFSAWLPAAMAAPTPVSALVHSSTLVTAGVYLLIRFNYILGVNNFLFYVGVITMFMSGLGANYETDLKKIIALSTLSQLGLIIIRLSLGFYEFAFFHLMTHAIFKSLLFLCAGVFIHSMGDIQDIRILGGLIISCPVTSFYFICSSMALCGFPFLSGFYSKDMILELFFIRKMNFFMLVVVFLATMFTLTYSVRLIYYLFFNNLGLKSLVNLGEESGMLLPISLLVLLSLIAGGWMRVFMFPINFIFLPIMFKMVVLVGILIIFFLYFYFLNRKLLSQSSATSLIVRYLGSMWFLPSLRRILFMPLIKLGSLFMKFVDQGWLEFLGGQGILAKSIKISSNIDLFNFINVKFYLFMFFMVLSFIFLVVN